jgi:hypothetical protein
MPRKNPGHFFYPDYITFADLIKNSKNYPLNLWAAYLK